MHRAHRLAMIIICAKQFLNLIMQYRVMDQTRTGLTEPYIQRLSVDCDLDLGPRNMILVRDTPSYHDNHLCQIIFRSRYRGRSYKPDTILKCVNGQTHKPTNQHTYILPPFHMGVGVGGGLGAKKSVIYETDSVRSDTEHFYLTLYCIAFLL